MQSLIIAVLIGALCLASSGCLARGGFSSSGGRGGFSSSRSYSSPSRSYSSPVRSSSLPSRNTTVTRTITVNRGYGGSGYYGSYGHPMMMGGFGMGYGYSNGIITGLILGNLMHPQGTTVYGGGGYQGGSALLYPDGRVVDQNGYQVGTYVNGQFTAVQGGMVAQPAPAPVPQPVPVVIDGSASGWEIVGCFVVAIVAIFILIAIFA